MEAYEMTRIWNRTLATQTADPYVNERDRLRNAYRTFRARSIAVAAQISTAMPRLTRHDDEHFDALWKTTDLLVDETYPLSPVEAFILGGAFLLHDLGLSLAAYEGGLAEVQAQTYWKDTLIAILRAELRRPPRAKEIEQPPTGVKDTATELTLRWLHADKSARLGTMSFRHRDRDETFYLIEDTDLRWQYGELIGRLAQSHGNDIDHVATEFDRIGAPPFLPNTWSIDTLKIACMLRASDACQLDSLRAPLFQAALKKPTGVSELHWRFQSHLQTPEVRGGRIHFTSARPFTVEERDAWWLGYDLLRQADRELNDVDSVLRQRDRIPLLANRVAGIESPVRLARCLQTRDWAPVDTSLKVTDVAHVVQTLAGEGLYGRNPTVALRELVQNARDAVVARRVVESRPVDWGAITVRLFDEHDAQWLEVDDQGIGMSDAVLTGPLLDFGQSYWSSDLVRREWPSLFSRGFQPHGKFGIGFFSVFMLGSEVTITTLRAGYAKADTQVLEFSKGLRARPVLRPAVESEQRCDPGTCVRIRLQNRAVKAGGILGPMNFEQGRFDRIRRVSPWALKDLCEWLCPALDVDLWVRHNETESLAMRANDWQTIESKALLRRLVLDREEHEDILAREPTSLLLTHLREIRDDTGRLIGRAFLWPWAGAAGSEQTTGFEGVVTAGAFRGTARPNVIGLCLGRASVASRYDATPEAIDFPLHLLQWSEEQARLLAHVNIDLNAAAQAAISVRSVGASSGPLPVAITQAGVVSCDELAASHELPTEVVLFEAPLVAGSPWFVTALATPSERCLEMHSTPLWRTRPTPSRKLLENAIGVISGRMMGALFYLPLGKTEDPKGRSRHPVWQRYWMSCWGAVMEAIATAWGVTLDEMLNVSTFAGKGTATPTYIGIDEHGKRIVSSEVDILRRPPITSAK